MKNKNNFLRTFTIVILVFCLFFLVVGVTYSIYSNFLKGSTSNIITTGNIAFSYTEGDFVGNGIKIENAYPISDSDGKTLFGSKNYFDFSINGNSTISDINYEIVVQKQSNSTMNESAVKIYLTEKTASGEVPSSLVLGNTVYTYDMLESSSRQNGKIMYLGNFKKGTSNYVKDFRLRMWISDDVSNITELVNREFSIKVNVVAY